MNEDYPFLSVIIPTYARPQRLSACLEAIACQDYPKQRFEVIVVDDGGKTPLDGIIDTFQGKIAVDLLAIPHGGPAQARNAGANKAKGRFLLFTDDDCQPAPNWLQALAVRFAKMPDCAIGGSVVNDLADNPYSCASQMLIDYLYSYYNADPHNSQLFTSNNFALPREYFQSTGGFDTTFPQAAGEDREFCARLTTLGFQMIYAPEAVVHHAHPLSLISFWKQHFNYGRAAFHFRQLRAKYCRTGVKIEPLSFYLHLLAFPFTKAKGLQAIFLAFLSFISQAANACGFFAEMTKKPVRSLTGKIKKARIKNGVR